MSIVSDMSSNGKTDKVLRAILKHLDVMDAKLSRLDPISDKVTALEVDTGELGAHQDTLATVVERIDRAHAALAMQTTTTTTAATSSPRCTNQSSLNTTAPMTHCLGSTSANDMSMFVRGILPPQRHPALVPSDGAQRRQADVALVRPISECLFRASPHGQSH
jgi:hypothetical protein